jgi:hypothetical protein
LLFAQLLIGLWAYFNRKLSSGFEFRGNCSQRKATFLPAKGGVAFIWETKSRRERRLIDEVDYNLDKNEVLLDTKALLRKF